MHRFSFFTRCDVYFESVIFCIILKKNFALRFLVKTSLFGECVYIIHTKIYRYICLIIIDCHVTLLAYVMTYMI